MMQGFGSYQPQIQQAAAGYGGYNGFGQTVTTTSTDPNVIAMTKTASRWMLAFWIVDTASMAACAYHGYKRNNSIGWAIGWALLGGMFPIITPVIAVAQGFGKPIGAKANRARRRRARRTRRP